MDEVRTVPSAANIRWFWENVEKTEALAEGSKGCWNWHGCILTSGYPVLNSTRQQQFGTTSPALASYVMAHPSQPTPGRVYRACENPLCVNPKHLKTYRGKNLLMRQAGQKGGVETLRRHGREHFEAMSRKRWADRCAPVPAEIHEEPVRPSENSPPPISITLRPSLGQRALAAVRRVLSG